MPRTKADISNTAVRMFLQEVGKRYDDLRGMPRYAGTKAQKREILEYFDDECCYCGVHVGLQNLNQDHLIPMNKQSLGLHAWGNVVPTCGSCNSKKQQKDWEAYLSICCPDDVELEASRKAKLLRFMEHYEYEPNVELSAVAGNLYEDVGEVALTLINLRFKQAEAMLEKIHMSA
jgi:hypothetical protein